MLSCSGLHIRQGEFELRADFAFRDGGITALIGPSGAGKSTFLAAIAGFLVPAAGEIMHDGTNMIDLAPGQRPISILFQDNNLFPHLTVAQNAGLALQPRLRLSKDEAAQISDVLRRVGLGGFGDRLPAALSGGQQSRAALARVLLADRPVVLLDEPFAALGPGLKGEMLDLVYKTLSRTGRTVVMVTHDPADAKRVADDIVLVTNGHAAAPAPTAQMFASPPPAFATYLGGGS